MKKILLSGLVAFPLVTNAQVIISQDFDNYTSGATIAAASAGVFETWSGGTGTGEDAFVSNAFSNSPSNSLNVYNNGPGAYLHDIVLPFPSTYTTGIYELTMKYYIPTGSGGYFNLGSVWTTGGAGYQYGMDVFFNTDASGNVNTANSNNFTYTQNAWTDIRIIVNLNTGNCELFINSNSIFVGIWNAAGGFGVVDIFGYAYTNTGNTAEATSNFYVDDIVLTNLSTIGIVENNHEININIFPNPSNGNFNISVQNATGNYSLTVTDLIGQVVQSQNLTLTETASINYDLNVPSGIYFINLSNENSTIIKKIIIE